MAMLGLPGCVVSMAVGFGDELESIVESDAVEAFCLVWGAGAVVRPAAELGA